ncbi:hypothetical protein DFQ27_001052 [Actinomortierella ambigua]|uniref:Ricin B lectin domain-containing protein n=1 Tax=Actinomortierella ambigua TaxID=1343610 RepID=A0A9P6PJE3_9FUNG|nr:hypothetical protein DFQ27_001052 [Actinomortierella ambigua]
MHKAILSLLLLFVIVQTILAAGDHGLTSGTYKIWRGSYNAPPRTHQYFTAKPDNRDGVVVLAGPTNKKDQLWKVKVRSNGQITVESKAAKGKYLSTGREGNNNHALVRLGSSQRFDVTRKAGGPFTSFELAHPRKTSAGHITVVSGSKSNDPQGNEYIAYINQNTEGYSQSFKFSKVA